MFLTNKYHFLPTEDGSTGGDAAPPAAAPETDDAKAKLAEFRTNNRLLQKELEAAKAEMGQVRQRYDGIDPDAYHKYQEQIQSMKADEEKSLMAEGKIDEVVQRRVANAIMRKEEDLKASQEALEKIQSKYRQTEEQLGRYLIERDLQVELSKQGLKPKAGALEDVLARTRSNWKLNAEGKPEAYEPDGNSKMYGEQGAPINMSEYVQSRLFRSASHLFEGPKGGGSDGSAEVTTAADGVIRIPRSNAEMRSRYTKEIATGKAEIVDG